MTPRPAQCNGATVGASRPTTYPIHSPLYCASSVSTELASKSTEATYRGTVVLLYSQQPFQYTHLFTIFLFLGNFNFNTVCMNSSAVVQLERLYLTFAGWLKVPRPFSYQKKPTCGHKDPAKAEYFTGSNGQSRTSL